MLTYKSTNILTLTPMRIFRFAAPACLSLLCLAFTPAKDSHNAPGYCAAEVKFTCPIDGAKFTSPVAYSITDEGVRRDLMQVNGNGKYYEHLVHQCPKCHYSGSQADFEEEFTEDQKKLVLRYLKKNARRKLDQVQENLVAAEIYDILGSADDAQADFYLYASYLLSEKPARAEERKAYQLKSAELYATREFAADEESQKAKARTLYLVAELYRRAGKFDTSTEFFAKADAIAHKPEWLPVMIEEQSLLAIEGNADDKL